MAVQTQRYKRESSQSSLYAECFHDLLAYVECEGSIVNACVHLDVCGIYIYICNQICVWLCYRVIRPPMVVNARVADELYGKRDAAYTVPKFQHYSMEV